MPEPFFDRLTKVVSQCGPLCVGLDPSSALLERWGLPDDPGGAERLVRTVLGSVHGVAGVVKAQVAYYERFGAAGFAVLERVVREATDMGFLVIGDAKRGDIPSTTTAYASAWLADGAPLRVDAVTLSAYLGLEALRPALELAHATGRGAFVVVASSNDEGRALQTATHPDGRTVEAAMLAELQVMNASLGAPGAASRCAGAVLGAQRRVEGAAAFGGPVLIPGLGAQGSSPSDVAALRGTLGHDAVCVNVARTVLATGPSGEHVRDAAARVADSLR
jgi:orotidine-5'-phosphate decarboxylase